VATSQERRSKEKSQNKYVDHIVHQGELLLSFDGLFLLQQQQICSGKDRQKGTAASTPSTTFSMPTATLR
jgi:hypothetical protein